MHPRRITRLNELILQKVSQLILKLVDPDLGLITITGAKTTADISLTRIYYSVLGEPKQREATQAALEKLKGYMRREVAQFENLRRVPQIEFLFDESVEKADRLNRLLKTIHEEQEESEPPTPRRTSNDS
ncbi:MAG: 30S ribosome-binding factor RbfA [Elusimicrobia bacterium]|nr:30S ribosome-binding factor RbfA [Candidatus Obscuribacterium magneticum]